jgi:hypothetical protein
LSELSSALARLGRHRRVSKPMILSPPALSPKPCSGQELHPTLQATKPSLCEAALGASGAGDSIITPHLAIQAQIPPEFATQTQNSSTSLPLKTQQAAQLHSTAAITTCTPPSIRISHSFLRNNLEKLRQITWEVHGHAHGKDWVKQTLSPRRRPIPEPSDFQDPDSKLVGDWIERCFSRRRGCQFGKLAENSRNCGMR